VLLPGIIYSADNGRLICLQCAGMSAKFSGHDISGQKVTPLPWSETKEWFKKFGKCMSCEGNCTVYTNPASPEHLESWAKIEAKRPPSLWECREILRSVGEMVRYFHEHEGCPSTLRDYNAMIKRLDDAIKGGAE
jgi:hypothetical protein